MPPSKTCEDNSGPPHITIFLLLLTFSPPAAGLSSGLSSPPWSVIPTVVGYAPHR